MKKHKKFQAKNKNKDLVMTLKGERKRLYMDLELLPRSSNMQHNMITEMRLKAIIKYQMIVKTKNIGNRVRKRSSSAPIVNGRPSLMYLSFC